MTATPAAVSNILLSGLVAGLLSGLPLGPDLQAQTRQPVPPQITVDDFARRYVIDGGQPLRIDLRNITEVQVTGRDLENDIGFNIKYWHLGLGARIVCNRSEFAVRSVRIEAIHFRDGGSTATVFYTTETEGPHAEPAQAGCAQTRTELTLLRLIDGELFAPDWGRRLVRRR